MNLINKLFLIFILSVNVFGTEFKSYLNIGEALRIFIPHDWVITFTSERLFSADTIESNFGRDSIPAHIFLDFYHRDEFIGMNSFQEIEDGITKGTTREHILIERTYYSELKTDYKMFELSYLHDVEKSHPDHGVMTRLFVIQKDESIIHLRLNGDVKHFYKNGIFDQIISRFELDVELNFYENLK